LEDELQFRYQRPTFKGTEPDFEEDYSNFCILLRALDINEIGPAYAYGISPVLIDILNVDHKHAAIAQDPLNDTREVLESAPEGPALILWNSGDGESGPLDKFWCLVRFPSESTVPTLWEATGAASGNNITGKRIKSDGTLKGDDQNFWVIT